MSSKKKTATAKEEAKPALVPNLRFPGFRGEEGWTFEAGGSLFNQVNDRNPESGLPVLAVTQEHGAIPRHMIDYHVSVTEKSLGSYKVVRVGDFIISLRSFQGGIEYSRYHGICSPAYVILRRRGEGSDEYFRHYLKTDRFIRILTKNLEGLRDGKMISYAQFSELMLPVPKPTEQQRIAECLSSVDELMAAQTRKVDLLKNHKKGLMERLFPCKGETQPRLRFPEFQNAGEWEDEHLGDYFDPIRNGFVGTATPYYTTSDGVRYLQGRNIKQGRIEAENLIFITSEFHNRQRKSHLKTGDILMVQSGHVGECAVVGPDFAEANCHALVILTPKRKLSSEFFAHYFYSPIGKLAIFTITTGNTIKHILASELKTLPVLVPGLAEQQRIASCLSNLDAWISVEAQKLEAFKAHKKGLMQRLFPSPEEFDA
ncbi:restriction endonuclease subunit S [Paraburkholderia sp. 22099]|uniref:restriction endonuclease subunit S n=1 Tax=Paraburkholderia sp. 22099 TaxID=3453875 RepID=UPI003F843339